MTDAPTWVGIDGGGTRATAVAIDDAGTELARRTGGAGLVDPADPLAGVPALIALARETLQAADASATAAGLCCALAGAGRPALQSALTTAIASANVAGKIRVVTDAEAAMRHAFGGGPGVLLIAGTGSIAWARGENGRIVRAGGWGALLGDEGSGYAVGIAGLRAVARAADGRGLLTALTDRLLAATACVDPMALIPWAATAGKSGIAALAPTVLEAATAGDVVATGIAENAACELAQQANAVIAASGPWTNAIPLALAGGLIAPGGGLRERTWREVAAGGGALGFALREEPVDAALGAAHVARAGG